MNTYFPFDDPALTIIAALVVIAGNNLAAYYRHPHYQKGRILFNCWSDGIFALLIVLFGGWICFIGAVYTPFMIKYIYDKYYNIKE